MAVCGRWRGVVPRHLARVPSTPHGASRRHSSAEFLYSTVPTQPPTHTANCYRKTTDGNHRDWSAPRRLSMPRNPKHPARGERKSACAAAAGAPDIEMPPMASCATRTATGAPGRTAHRQARSRAAGIERPPTQPPRAITPPHLDHWRLEAPLSTRSKNHPRHARARGTSQLHLPL